MTDPRRLIDDPSCLALDRAVLASAANDAPSEAARHAARIALGIGTAAALPLTAGSAGSAAPVAKAAVAKAVVAWTAGLKASAVLVLCSIAAAVVAKSMLLHGGGEDANTSTRPSSTATTRPPASIVAPTPTIEVRRVDDLPSVPPSMSNVTAAQTAVVRVTPSPSAGPSFARAAPSASRMNEEIAVLDAARAQLNAQDPGGALGTLSRYEREHPQGALAREASILRVDAYLALGDTASARRIAAAYVAEYPTSPATPRLRAFLDKKE